MRQVNSTETTPAPALGGRQVGQLLAGRYRLGLFKGGDDVADVWHALDESSEQVVTLEILRDRDNDATRQRFLAEGQRMAAIERPSVMRVAAIHNTAPDTFIVFEHLIPLPVVLTGLSAIAKDVKPATAAEAKTVVLASVAGPTRSAATPEPPVAEPDDERTPEPILKAAPDAPGATAVLDLDVIAPPAPIPTPTPVMPETLQAVSRSLLTVRAEAAGLAARAARLGADARLRLRGLRLDTSSVTARAAIPDIDTSGLTALVARTSSSIRKLASGMSAATGAVVRLGPVLRPAVAVATRAAATAATSVAPIIARARPNRIVIGGVVGTLLLVGFVMSPLDDMAVSALRSTTAPSPSVAPSVALAPAPFDLPPLGAYGATFESQGAYPTAAPNSTVEWVVALRNTGSAGWYRGIDGAQAALALPDGSGVAVQSTEYVGPGQVGWFVVHFRARAEIGTYTVSLLPRIDGRGPLQDLGIYTVVTVSKNP